MIYYRRNFALVCQFPKGLSQSPVVNLRATYYVDAIQCILVVACLDSQPMGIVETGDRAV